MTQYELLDKLRYSNDKLFYLSIVLAIIIRLPWYRVPFFISDEALILTIGGQIVHDGAIYGKGFVDTRGPGGYYIGALLTYIFGFGNFEAFHLFGIFIQIIIVLLIKRLGQQLY